MPDFLSPSYEIAIQNIPRVFTALAEWMGCLVYIYVLRKRKDNARTAIIALAFLFLLVLLQMIDGILPLSLWTLGMLMAILMMFCFLYETLESTMISALYTTAHAFLIAELVASFEWQIYYYFSLSFSVFQKPSCMLLSMLAVYIPCFILIARTEKPVLEEEEPLYVSKKELVVVLLTTLITFLFSNLSFVTPNTPFSSQGDSDIFYSRTLVDLGGCILLYSYQYQRMFLRARKETDALQNLLEKQYDQYRMSKENVELINRKYHDLKHKLQLIRLTEDSKERQQYLEQMEEEIKRYEVELKTGNSVLDIILTSKNLAFKENGVSFLCIADGSLLSFMDTMDICSIFGNALDNALESVIELKEPEKRIIRLKLCRQSGFILLNIENNYEHKLARDGEGLLTTKQQERGYHGYGLKSIELSAKKYGGTMSVNTDGGTFSLNLLFPVRNGQA